MREEATMVNQSSKARNMTWRWMISALTLTALFYGIVRIVARPLITIPGVQIAGYYVRMPFPASELFWGAVAMALYAEIAAQITMSYSAFRTVSYAGTAVKIVFWFIFGVLSGMLFETFFGLPLELSFNIHVADISFWILWGLVFWPIFSLFFRKNIVENYDPSLLIYVFGYGFNSGFVLNMALRFQLLTHWDIYWTYWLIKVLFGLHAGLFIGLIIWLFISAMMPIWTQRLFDRASGWFAGE